MSGKIKNMVGQIFADLTVLRMEKVTKQGAFWVCLCKCGKETIVRGACLRLGRTKSCGHLVSEKNHNKLKTHCKKGHEFTTENTRINSDGSRHCKTCQVDRDFKHYLDRYGKLPEEVNRHQDLSAEERKEHRRIYGIEYRQIHPDMRDGRERNARARHGLSGKEYDARREIQRLEGDLCGVCKKPLVESPAANLDHNHETGQLREFLHIECNMALGLLKDDPKICRLAAEYLEKYEEIYMAFMSKDGRKFGSSFVAKRKDMEHDKSAPPMDNEGEGLMKKTSPAPAAPAVGAPEEQKPGMGAPPEDPKQVVAQHGKATTVHVAHDRKNHKHHVVSTHEDGSVHESEHPDEKSAHNAAASLAGAGDQPMGDAMGAPEAPEADGFAMPRLS
jgi:hypothetical protein